MVMETRAQELAQARKEKDVLIADPMESRLSKIENKLDAQNLKIEGHIAEMFEAINMLSASKQSPATEPFTPARSSNFSAGCSSDMEFGRRSGHFNNYTGGRRLAKLAFPRFCGEQVKEWIFKVDQFFKLDHTPEELKVSVVSIHLDGIAAMWHQNLVEDDVDLSDWNTYKLRVRERFDEVGEDPISELKKLQETEGIKEYHAKFENIRTRVKLPESYLVSAYLAGLRLDTQMHIRMFAPKTVQQCLLLGRLYETAHPRKSPASPWTMSKHSNKSQVPFRKDNEPHITKTVLPERPRDNQMQPRKFLSNEEMSARRAKGLCYFCDEQYTPEHYKVHRKAQLFVL